MKYMDIFMAFFRSGLLCFGGGPASIPFVYREAVERYKWMTDEEFAEVVAIGNTLPGPINTKMAGYIGYRVGGILGLLIALVGAVLPTAILMIVLMTTLSRFSDEVWARGMTRAMVPVVGVMLSVVGWQFLSIAAKGLGWSVTIAHVFIVGLLIFFVQPHPAIILAGLFVWAFLGQSLYERLRPKAGYEVKDEAGPNAELKSKHESKLEAKPADSEGNEVSSDDTSSDEIDGE